MTLLAPTGARTIVFDDGPTMLRGLAVTPPIPAWPAKDPTDDLNYAADFSRVIQGTQTIAGQPVLTVLSGTLSILQSDVVGTVVIFRATGGVDGTVIEVAVSVTLSDGQVITRVATLPVIQLVPAVPPLSWGADFSAAANSGAYAFLA
jgi:hypothetical protein